MRTLSSLACLALIAQTAAAAPGETRRQVTQRALNVALSAANGQGCISCHVTGQVMAAVGAAEVSGFAPNEAQANRVLQYGWDQQIGNGSIVHGGSSYPIETSAWVAWALSYYGEDSRLDVRDQAIANLGNWLLAQRGNDGGLPPNDHNSGIISIPSRVMPTMSAARISQWLFNQTGEMRYRTGMADLGRFLAATEPAAWHNDSGLLETTYELIGLAATGRSARDPKMAALRDALLARQRNGSCWGFERNAGCDAFSTGLVGNALLDSGMLVGHPALQAATAWLINQNGRSGWWPRQLFRNDVSVSTNPVIYLSRIPVFYIGHLTPENGSTFDDGEPHTVISTDGISEDSLDYELTLFIDNIPVARSRNAGIEYRWNLRNVTPGQHRIRVVGIDSEGYADTRESVVLVGDYVGLLGTVTPNPFNADATNALIEYEVFGQANAQITMQVHATKDDEQGVPRRAGLPCTQENAAQVCVSEGSTCEDSAGEPGVMRCSADSVHRSLIEGEIQPGMHVQAFDGRDQAGNRLPDGVYLVHFTARRGENEQTGSVLVGVLSDEPAEIRGTVKDRDTDRGIPGARVVLQTPLGGRMQVGEVGLTGSYVLPLIRPGSYRVVAEVPGYPEPQPVPIDLAPGQRERLDFWLTGNQPPFFAPVDPVEPLVEGETFRLDVRAYDMQNDPIRLSATTPMGGRFEDLGEGRGRFTWTVPFGTQRATSLLLEATDGQGLTELLIPLPIAQTNRPPTLEGLEAAALRAGQVFERRLHATDPDGDEVTIRVEGLPPGAVWNGETLSYTPPVALLARFDVRVTATDDGTPAAVTEGILSLAIGPPNSAPQLRPQERLVVPVQSDYEHRFEAIDPDGDRVHFTATGLPDGLSISRDGVLSGQAAAELANTTSLVTITAHDDHRPAGSKSIEVKLVFVAPDNEPFIELPERIEVTPGQVWRHRVRFGAPQGREHLRLRVMIGPVGLDLMGDGETLRWAVPEDFDGQTPLRLRLMGTRPPVSANAVIVSVEGNLPPVIKIEGEPAFDAAGSVTIDASFSFDPEGAQLVYEWNPAAGLSVIDDDGAGVVRLQRERADANRVVLVVSDGTHRVSQTIRIEEPVGGGVPDGCSTSGASTWLALLAALIVLGRRRRLALGALALIAAQACSFMDAPAPPAQPLSTLIPGLIELSVPDASGVVTVQGERGAAEPEAKVRITAVGDPVEVEADASGAFVITIEAGDGDALSARQVIDGVASSPVVLNVPVRAPKGMAWLEDDGSGGDELVIRPKLLADATARVELSTGWVELPDADADGRIALPLAEGSLQAGDPITIEQTLAGKPSRSGSVYVMDAASSDGVAVTPSASESGTLWVSGPPTQGRSGAFVLVTNMSIESLPQGRVRAHEDGSFGPLQMPGRNGDKLRIEVVAEMDESSFDVLAPINSLRVRLVWSADGSLVVTGSPGTAHPSAEILVKLADSQQEILATADEVGGFRVAVVASAGEVLQIQQGTSTGGVLTWSAPTRKRAPQTGLAYPKDQLRTRWQNGELSVSGIGCDIPGASGVTVSIVGLGGDAIPAEPASSAVLDETGGFEVVVPGVTAGDRVVVRVVLGGQQSEPALLTVPSPGTSIAAGETTLTVGPSATGDPLWRTIGLAPGSYEPGTQVRLSAGVQEAGDGFKGARGSAGVHRPSASGWTVTVGADGGCGQRLIKLHAGVSIELIAGDADPVYSEVTGLDPETIAITMPNDAGDVMIVGAPGAAPQGSVIEADVEGGVSVRREAGDDGAFSLTIPGQTGQSISLKLDLPRCGCQSVTLILEVPGRGDPSATLPPLTHQLLQTWRLPQGVHIGGDAGTTEPGTAILAMAGFQAVRTVADRTGAFELRVFAEPGAPVTLRAQRGSARSDAVSLCAPEVAGLHGLAMTACAGRFQLSGRPGSLAPAETITWTRTDVTPQVATAQVVASNRAPYVATWRIPESARLALTLSDATVVVNPTAPPRNDSPLRVIGPFADRYMLYAAPGTMNGVNTIDLWRGLGAQQRFLAQARRGQNGSVQHLFESVQASVNVYETRSGTEHFPFLLRAGLSVEVPLMRGGWSTERLGRTSGRLRYTGTELTTDDRVVIFHPETITQLAETQPTPSTGEEIPEGQVELQLDFDVSVPDASDHGGAQVWLVIFRPDGVTRPYRLYIHKGGIIPESADVDGDRLVDNLRDTDGDGIPDLADTDSDNDGIPDEREAGDGETPRDTDEDGTPDYRETDSDGDGLSDRFEAGDDPNAPRDTDGDSIPDYLDDDSDGNGITDVDERGQGDEPADFDGDGVADLFDTDDDNDGVSDAVEIGEDPSNPVISVEGSNPDYRNPCYPRTPIALSTRPVSQSDLVVALPEWIDADSAGPLSGDLPPVGEGCERPDLDAELVRRSAGLRYRNAEGTVLGATLARHLPADLDELPGWQQPIQFIETALAKARETGLVTQGPGARRLTIGGHPAATVSIQVVVPSTASEVVLETLASHLLADCFTNEEDQVVCPPRALLARDPAGPEGTRFELTLTARLRCAGKLDLQLGVSLLDGDAAAQALAAARSRMLGQGSIWAESGAQLEKVCIDRTYGNAGSQVDFIFVVDGSGSMEEEQAALARAVNHLQTAMSQAGVNWRAGVTTMEADAGVRGGDGQLLGGGFTSNVNTLRTLVTSVGTSGSGREYGMRALRRSLQRASEDARDGSAFRLRRDVPVAFIVLTDTEDQSVRQQGCRETDANGDGRSDDADCVDRAIQPTLSLLRGEMGGLEAPQGLDRLARVFAITSHPNDACLEAESYGWGWRAVAEESGGSVGNICGANLDYTELLRRMGEQAINVLPELGDGRALIESSIQITTGSEDARITRDPTLWRMDASTHRLRLLDAARPAPGQQLGYSGSIWTTP